MEGILLGMFGTEAETKSKIEAAIAKKSEAEGVVIYHRTESGVKLSFLDDLSFPDRIQGYARIASIADSALYLFPRSGRLASPDGELAVLLESFSLDGRLIIADGSCTPEAARGSLRGTVVAEYRVEERQSVSSSFDAAGLAPPPDSARGTLVYLDRVFTVKGVGAVALGFVLSGAVSVHDKLRPLPGNEEAVADVRSIQVNDEEFQSAGRGMRVGLSLRGVEADELGKSHWLDDGSYRLADRFTLDFKRSRFYKGELVGRSLHLQLPGEMLVAAFEGGSSETELVASLPSQVPVWEGMKVAVIDLNGKGLRVAGGGTCKL